MNSCSEFRDSLLDHALGLPRTSDVESHLAGCKACARALERWRSQVRQIDSGVRRLVAIEPSPFLVPSVLAKANASPSLALWPRRWKVAFASLALIAVACLAGVTAHRAIEKRREAQVISIARSLSRWKSPTESLLRSPVDPLLKNLPRLGESFFEVKTEFKPLRRGKGEKNAS